MHADPSRYAHEIEVLRANNTASLMTRNELSVIAWLTCQLKHPKVIVETGTAFGGSAKVIRENIPESCKLICIDPIWSVDDMHAAYRTLNINRYGMCNLGAYQDPLDFIKQYIGDTQYTEFIGETSPYGLSDMFSDPIDLLLEDSTHTSPQLEDNLEFWWPRIKPGGILAGHDFSLEYPHVIDVVLTLSQKFDCGLSVCESVFWMQKPRS